MLQGLGEPFKQIREFVKDLWFRNGQERRHGDLDLLERQLELAAKYGLLDSEEGHAAAAALLNSRPRPLPSHSELRRELPRGDS